MKEFYMMYLFCAIGAFIGLIITIIIQLILNKKYPSE